MDNPWHRVKLYLLSDDGRESTEHTPEMKIEYLDGSEGLGLYLFNEDDNERRLLHKIIPADNYRRVDNDIVFRAPRIVSEIFLRFEEKSSCDSVWDCICRGRRNMKFNDLVTNMLSDLGDCEFSGILRNLADSEVNSIVDIFYERYLGQLIDVIVSSSQVNPENLLQICDLLNFCILDHPNDIIKSNFLVNNLVDKVLVLAQRREKYLVAAAVRFLKTLVLLKDDHVEEYIVKNDLFRHIIFAFVENGRRYNLLNSTVLELFEFIRKENLKTLLKYLVESYWEKLVQFDYLPSIFEVRVKYNQQIHERSLQRDEREPEKEEDDWFNEDGKEDSIAESMLESKDSTSNSCKLVDYEDDDDDDDVGWKHRKKMRIF